jgi:hypothetical protein
VGQFHHHKVTTTRPRQPAPGLPGDGEPQGPRGSRSRRNTPLRLKARQGGSLEAPGLSRRLGALPKPQAPRARPHIMSHQSFFILKIKEHIIAFQSEFSATLSDINEH